MFEEAKKGVLGLPRPLGLTPLKNLGMGGLNIGLNPGQRIAVNAKTISLEEAVKVVAQSDWARNTAIGMVEKLFGMRPTDPKYEETVKAVAEKIARGALT